MHRGVALAAVVLRRHGRTLLGAGGGVGSLAGGRCGGGGVGFRQRLQREKVVEMVGKRLLRLQNLADIGCMFSLCYFLHVSTSVLNL